MVLNMSQDNAEKFPQELWELRSQAAQVKELEETWKIQRAALRELAIKAVLDDGFSVVKAADIAGVQRQTLSVWLEIEKGVRKRLNK